VTPIPADIEIEGYKGSLASWTSIGNWVDQLNSGKSELSPETIALLKEKVKSCSTDYEKAAVVYAYMQSKTRYLNITIGIGGWQPIAASTIDRLGYGDCKALSNYTKSLLEAVGIKSYYTLIRAGEAIDQIDMNFPQIKFNHVILCVPFVNDTVWLECTSQNLPFGFIGDFTDDRNALLITENGGQMVHTRKYNAEENAVVRNIVMNLDEAGYATVSETEFNKGIQYSEKLPLFLAGMEDRKKLILDRLNIPGVLLNNFQFEEVRSQLPVLKEKLELEIPRYATIMGTRMLVSLIPIEKFKEMPKKVNNRMTDVIIRRSKLTVDTIKIAIPEGFQAESIPSEIKTDSRFGSYMLKTAVVNNQIICIRRFEMKKGQHSAQTYSELIDFLRKVATADNSKVSLKKYN
jgi:hypothetical protein